MAARRKSYSSESIRSQIAREAATAAVEQFVRGPAFDDVVERAVNKMLQGFGVDTKNPEAMREDLHALRDWRKTREMVRQKGLLTVVGTIASFLVLALATGCVVVLKKSGLL